MEHVLFLGFALIGVLFTGITTGMTRAQMKLDNPDDDPLFHLQRTMAEKFGYEGWARLQRSKFVRTLSYLTSLTLFVVFLALAVWQGVLAFS